MVTPLSNWVAGDYIGKVHMVGILLKAALWNSKDLTHFSIASPTCIHTHLIFLPYTLADRKF
jgi:hypothetical protein